MTHEELKTCPFCGGESVLIFDGDPRAQTIFSRDYFVRCTMCLAESNRCSSEKIAKKVWNRRVYE